MLIQEDGRFEGSVSGGCVEGAVLAAGEEVAAGRSDSQLLRFGVSSDSAWEVGLPCGGEIEILVQPVGEHGFPPSLFGTISERRKRGAVTVVRTDLATGKSILADEVAGEGFCNEYLPPRRLLIVGAVQIAQSLARIVAELGIAVTIIDPRSRFLTAERFPNVALDDRWPDEAVRAHAPDVATSLVTLSHDPKIDDPALLEALAAPTGYIAALGSRKSHAARCLRLAEMGVQPADIARIEGPAGVDIAAIGASEIALSIAAGMIKAMAARLAAAPPKTKDLAKAVRECGLATASIH